MFVIVCIDILTRYSEFNKPAMCTMFTCPLYSIMCFVLPLRTELTTHFILSNFVLLLFCWGNCQKHKELFLDRFFFMASPNLSIPKFSIGQMSLQWLKFSCTVIRSSLKE